MWSVTGVLPSSSGSLCVPPGKTSDIITIESPISIRPCISLPSGMACLSLMYSLVLFRFREILPGGTEAHESIYQKDCACGTYQEDSTGGENEGAYDSTGGHGSAYIDHDLPVPHGPGPIDRWSARLFLNRCFF